MGIPPGDCKIAGSLFGIKTFINEFVAYGDLGNVIKNRQIVEAFNGTWHHDIRGNIILDPVMDFPRVIYLLT